MQREVGSEVRHEEGTILLRTNAQLCGFVRLCDRRGGIQVKRLATFVLALGLGTGVIMGADASGKWFGKVPARGDTLADTTFVLKVEGTKLTGTVDGVRGLKPIANGQVSGDTISFLVEDERGNQSFKGTVSGDEIKFTRTGPNGQPRPFTATRVK